MYFPEVKNHKTLRRLLRDFAINVKPWQPAIYHHVKPDEVWNSPKIANLRYGDAGLSHIVLACAGVDSPELPITALTITMPTPETYYQLVRQANGYA